MTMTPSIDLHTPRPISEWSEEVGDVLWWEFPVREPPYLGTPNDLGYSVPIRIMGEEYTVSVGGWPGHHTHWTPLPDVATVQRNAVQGGAPDNANDEPKES